MEKTMTDAILFEIKDSVAWITFNRPENLNALDEEIGAEFTAILTKIKQNSQIRVAVLTGSGRAFSSGGNLNMLREKMEKSAIVNENELKAFYQTFLQIRDLDIPFIAAINGHAVGAGFCLALACDFRYASSKAKLGANFTKIGLAAGMGGTWLVNELAGPVFAREILMLGEVFSAQKAFNYGLLNKVCEPEELIQKVKAVSETLSHNSPIALRKIKKGLNIAPRKSLLEMFDYDSKAQAECFESEDIREGVDAISQKRPPQFKGC